MKQIFTFTFLLWIGFSFAQTQKEQIISMLNSWHQAASVADEDTFFDSMTADAHYLGTDASEDWTRDEMKVWAKDIFQKDTAWDFKTINRNIYINDENLAWFDETLDTWMGTCRGSGIVVLENGQWKIKHYVLSVAVPNEKIDDYLKLK